MGGTLALIIVLCISIPAISTYLIASESKNSTFTVAKQESGPEDGEIYYESDYKYTYSARDSGWAVSLNTAHT